MEDSQKGSCSILCLDPLQVVINPNYEVPESDFSNNIMKCRSRYDGYRIWMYNCHVGKFPQQPHPPPEARTQDTAALLSPEPEAANLGATGNGASIKFLAQKANQRCMKAWVGIGCSQPALAKERGWCKTGWPSKSRPRVYIRAGTKDINPPLV